MSDNPLAPPKADDLADRMSARAAKLSAPDSEAVIKARAAFPAFGAFAHKPITDMLAHTPSRMSRPKGGHGPHN